MSRMRQLADTSHAGGDHMVTTMIDVRIDVRLKNGKASDLSEAFRQATHRIRTDDLLITNQLLYRLS